MSTNSFPPFWNGNGEPKANVVTADITSGSAIVADFVQNAIDIIIATATCQKIRRRTMDLSGGVPTAANTMRMCQNQNKQTGTPTIGANRVLMGHHKDHTISNGNIQGDRKLAQATTTNEKIQHRSRRRNRGNLGLNGSGTESRAIGKPSQGIHVDVSRLCGASATVLF